MTDIEIANSIEKINIEDIAKKFEIENDSIELYGKYKAKVNVSNIKNLKEKENGKLILVTAINPTPAGEGKTTLTIGLGDALNKIGKKTIITLREPSLGPLFGTKGGATGGGLSQVVPMEDINLHFTGDIHAIESANNLLCSALDNHIYQGNALNIDINNILIKRSMDMNDRTLRNIKIGLGEKNGVERNDGFNITAASEVMAIFCLSNNLQELKTKLGNIIVAYNMNGNPVYARDLKVNGAMSVLLKDAIKPNIVQTLEHNLAIIHGGPFANIAHGCNSIIATKLALKLGDYVVTEAGFGSDLGAEKFIDIKCRQNNIEPSCIVLVATIRALKYNGNVDISNLNEENIDALKLGSSNLIKHIQNLKMFNKPIIVTINKFESDTDNEIELVKEICRTENVECIISNCYSKGSDGTIELANKVVSIIDNYDNDKNKINFIYDVNDSIKNKIEKIAKDIYGASDVSYSQKAEENILKLNELNLSNLPICVAKTQMSLSDNAKLLGAPKDYTFCINDVKISNGAGFIVCIAGSILTMPGLSKEPAYLNIDITDDEKIIGIF